MPNPADIPTFSAPARADDFVSGQVLVQFDPGAIADAAALPVRTAVASKLERLPSSVEEPLSFLRGNAGLRSVEPVFASSPVAKHKPADRDLLATIASVREAEGEVEAGAAILELPEKEIDNSLLKRIHRSSAVETVERLPARWLYGAADPRANLQWGLPAIRYFQARRPSAKKVRVAVLDSGIDTSHPDLPEPVLYRPGEFKSQDTIGHGTHVAGVIAALTNNGVGITGICDCELAVWKVFPDNSPRPSLDQRTYLRALGEIVSEGVDVVNLSLGGPAPPTKLEADLYRRAIEQGVTVVAAMGNDFERGNPTSYPAALDDVISVGAVDAARRRSAFSSTGRHIDLCAPGSSILSTLPQRRSPFREETGYAAWNGTSMATPLVTAAAALLKAKSPGRTPAQVAARLNRAAVGVPEMRGATWTQAHGNGLLNLRAALI